MNDSRMLKFMDFQVFQKFIHVKRKFFAKRSISKKNQRLIFKENTHGFFLGWFEHLKRKRMILFS